MNRTTAAILVAILGSTSLTLYAQGPTLETEDITVVGRRTILLPKARKGEVIDTSRYYLPPGEPMLYGPRLSNLGGSGGSLPIYRELEAPFGGGAELSAGSFLSPHGLVWGNYTTSRCDLGGRIDYRSTAGHVDSAEASALNVFLHAGVILGEDIPPLRSFRASGSFERLGQSYFLYGSSLSPFDRSTAITAISLALQSQEAHPVSYMARLSYSNTNISDGIVDTVPEVSATEPAFSFEIGGNLANTLRASARFGFSTTSLRYSAATLSPSSLAIEADVEWRPAPGLVLTGGAFYASGGHSDSGASHLFAPRIGARYILLPELSIFGWFSPELRTATYRHRLSAAPYVAREILLRPERVPVRLAGGMRFSSKAITLEGRGFYEEATNTPAVVAATAPGELRWIYLSSTSTIGVEASASLRPTESITIDADIRIASASDSLDRNVPMRPTIDMRTDGTFGITPKIDFTVTLQYQGDQTTSFVSDTFAAREIPSRFVVGVGAAYRPITNIEAFLDITNLLDSDYKLWDNYSAPGLEFRGGVRLRL